MASTKCRSSHQIAKETELDPATCAFLTFTTHGHAWPLPAFPAMPIR
jgi:hypothetical protein